MITKLVEEFWSGSVSEISSCPVIVRDRGTPLCQEFGYAMDRL